MKSKPSKGCLVRGILGILLALSLSVNFCLIRDKYFSVKYAPDPNQYPFDKVYTLSPEDKDRHITLLDFHGSITIFKRTTEKEFIHDEEIRTSKLEDGRWALSEKIPPSKERVLVLVRGTPTSTHGRTGATFTP